ncbi:hypothetical protein [Devosia faecipullorum]|uniref:hypothetical protein n=1 Tax=Devosia faecipullorum TaxID=2755039 RepID=UPI00187B31F0|nr:hypothetical protein [Devosia faecipullorum]MBE7732247.1 hypothetical protein [Devosia faecipullorum]
MRLLAGLALAGLMAPGLALAGPMGAQLPELLYAGTAKDQRDLFAADCRAGAADACFGTGMIDVVKAAEGLAGALYRHGATAPDMPAAAMLLGIPDGVEGGAPPDGAEPITYEKLRAILDEFITGLDAARQSFLLAGEGDDFVITIDPLRVRLDLNGDGVADEAETLAVLLGDMIELPQARSKGGKTAEVDTSIGFDRADAFWFAGYTQIIAAPVDLLLAHDFSEFFTAIGHRVFPSAGLPMQNYQSNSSLFVDPQTDTFLADAIAAIHLADFPVADAVRLQGVLARMQEVTGLSRRNWEAILAETDDNRELVPSPRQTSIVPGMEVSEEVVAAWMETLERVDAILAGELLLPHWRFAQGISLPAYFETAEETDLVMLFTGQGALPFLREGPVADADSFAAGNAVFGDRWPNFAIWFN